MLIAHWPARIKSHGRLRYQAGHLIDIMATCVDVSGAHYPARYKGNAIIPMEGRSLVPAFDNKAIGREAIYWEHEGNRAVRVGKWKLVSRHPGNLAEKHPQKAAELKAMYESWAKRCGVRPWPVKRTKKKK